MAGGIPAEIVFLQHHPGLSWRHRLDAAGLSYRFGDGTFRGLITCLRAARPLLLHTHGYKANLLGRAAARVAGVPAVSTYHAGLRERFPVGLYQLLDEWTGFLSTRVAVSAAVQSTLPWSAHLLPNFVPLPQAAAAAATHPAAVIFAGRLTPEKGPDRFCELAARSGLPLDWRIFGDGPMRAGLERRYGGLIRFEGFEEMSRVWPLAGLLVMPSRAEGLPMAALEAMAHGVPVLASDAGALPELIQHGKTGWVIAGFELESAGAALRAWHGLDGAALIAMQDACRARIAVHYGLDAGLDALMRIYEKAGVRLSPQTRQE
jgi:glycosyltransferase involved in cell wall biosynthesis